MRRVSFARSMAPAGRARQPGHGARGWRGGRARHQGL